MYRSLSTFLFSCVFITAGCSGGGGDGGGTTASSSGSICTGNENGITNKLGVHRLMRFNITQSQSISITATKSSGLSSADPDLRLYKNGSLVGLADGTSANSETLTVNVTAGDYVLDLLEFKYTSSGATPAITCYNVKVSYTAGSAKISQSSTKAIIEAAKATNATSTCASASEITVTGKITYDLVAHNTGTNGLNYSTGTTQEPVKGAVVEMRCAGGMYDTAITDASGNYSLTASNGVDNFVRVYAQMLDTTAPATWNFKVVDNTSSGALYSMDGTTINSAVNISNHNLNAASGWGGAAYTATRVAAPFAILDSVYTAFQKVLSIDSNAVFPALNINWSINNVAVSGNKAIGNITTSHFDGTAIYILGKADSDIDEYDEHVVIHEWAHYFEKNFSRSDSVGGSHSLSERLDIRLAFGEGFGNAYSGIASGDSVYRDASGASQSTGFGFDVNSNSCTNAGWYNECSVQSLLYDFNTQISFTAIYNVMTNAQKNTPAVTSIFSFTKALKDNNAASVGTINTLVSGQSIDVITDAYGDSELTNNPGMLDQLPVHTKLN